MKFAIQPVSILGQSADTAEVVGFSGLPPSYTVNLQKSTTTGTPPVTTYQTLITITRDCVMSEAQWDGWTTQPTDAYIADCVCANQGLEPA